MTHCNDCYKNALALRINGILKNEFLLYKCKNGKIKYRIESIDTYNDKKPYLSLHMKTPNFIHNKKNIEARFNSFI